MTAILTSVTGFLFPFERFLPSHWFGVISLIAFAVAILARYRFEYAGAWRWLYVLTVLLGTYLLAFVTVVQAFQKIPALHALAPTQSELPFAVAQLVTLVVFLGLGFMAIRKFHAGPARFRLIAVASGRRPDHVGHSVHQDVVARRCHSSDAGADRGAAAIAAGAIFLGGRGGVRAARPAASGGVRGDPGRDAALAAGIVLAGRHWRDMARFTSALRASRYDEIIDTQGLFRTALLARVARGRRHGYDSDERARTLRAAALYDVRHRVPRDLHAIARNRLLTGLALGYAARGRRSISGWTARGSLRGSDGYGILLHATARAEKEWPEDRWIALGEGAGFADELAGAALGQRGRANAQRPDRGGARQRPCAGAPIARPRRAR